MKKKRGAPPEPQKLVTLSQDVLVSSYRQLRKMRDTLVVSIAALKHQNAEYDREIASQLYLHVLTPLNNELAAHAQYAGLVNEMGGDGEE